MRTLNVKRTTAEEIEKHWGGKVPFIWRTRVLYIRCNFKGDVNWNTSPVYSSEELVGRNNVNVIPRTEIKI